MTLPKLKFAKENFILVFSIIILASIPFTISLLNTSQELRSGAADWDWGDVYDVEKPCHEACQALGYRRGGCIEGRCGRGMTKRKDLPANLLSTLVDDAGNACAASAAARNLSSWRFACCCYGAGWAGATYERGSESCATACRSADWKGGSCTDTCQKGYTLGGIAIGDTRGGGGCRNSMYCCCFNRAPRPTPRPPTPTPTPAPAGPSCTISCSPYGPNSGNVICHVTITSERPYHIYQGFGYCDGQRARHPSYTDIICSELTKTVSVTLREAGRSSFSCSAPVGGPGLPTPAPYYCRECVGSKCMQVGHSSPCSDTCRRPYDCINVTPTPTSPPVAPTPTPITESQPQAPSGGSGWEAADLDGNGELNIFDFIVFLGTYGQTGDNLVGDLDGDGGVTIMDVSIFIGLYRDHVLRR